MTQARHWNEEKKRAYRVADHQLESWREEFRNLKFGEFDPGLSRLLQGPHGSAAPSSWPRANLAGAGLLG